MLERKNLKASTLEGREHGLSLNFVGRVSGEVALRIAKEQLRFLPLVSVILWRGYDSQVK